MNDFNILLQVVIAEALSVGIPISNNIDPNVKINSRAQTRFGCCIRTGERYIIELTDKLLTATETACKEIIAHEILHTCYGCRNHGTRWKLYADKMNQALGYNIARTGSHEALGLKNTTPVRHLIVCRDCGLEIKRARHSELTRNPSKYRCKCGGKLILKY